MAGDYQVIVEAQFFLGNLNLLQRFTALVAAFNNYQNTQDINSIAVMLDDNVALITLSPPSIIRGKLNVTNYLQQKLQDPSVQFYPSNSTANDMTGRVEGTAVWHDADTVDQHGVNIGEKIHYSFTFVMHNDGNWYCTNLWGTSP